MAIAQPINENTEGSTSEAKDRLLSSALSLFSTKGYAATSIREIIEDAEVTRPVLYYYFKNKEDIFCQLVEAQFGVVCDFLDEVIESETGLEDRLKQIVHKNFKLANESPETVRLLLQFFFSPQIEHIALDKQKLSDDRFERYVCIMQDGMTEGAIPGGDPVGLVSVFSGIIDMHVMLASQREVGGLTPELGDGLVEFFLAGARTTKPIPGLYPLLGAAESDGSTYTGDES